jgi:hypothetical protein
VICIHQGLLGIVKHCLAHENFLAPLRFTPAISQQGAAPHAPAVQSGFTQPDAIDFDDHRVSQSMFDGKTLNSWDGDKNFWHVEDDAIVVSGPRDLRRLGRA